MTDFESFLSWEARSRDTIDFKKTYVDISRDVVAGLMLSQIIYWYLPGTDGEEKLRVEREGERWLVKSRDDWWAECRLSPREADRARKNLEGLGIIEVKVFKFNGSPTQHVRIIKERFLELWQKAVDEGFPNPRRKFPRGSGEGGGGIGEAQEHSKGAKSLKSPFSRNGEMDFTDRGDGFHPNGDIKFTNRGIPKTETTTKITSETTAAGAGPIASDADAALVRELVDHGVGRFVAVRLAREKPSACRRYLEYLPYAKPKTTPGAWLANAIRDEYGPPTGYVRAKQSEQRCTAVPETASKIEQEGRGRKKAARVRHAYEAMEKTQGEAYIAFERYLENERRRAELVTRVLSPQRQGELAAAFDRPERRLELFERWLQSDGQQFHRANQE